MSRKRFKKEARRTAHARRGPVLVSILALLLVFATSIARAQNISKQGASYAVAVDTSIRADRQATRFELITIGRIKPHVFVVSSPDRLVIDVDNMDFRLPPRTGNRGNGVIERFRFGALTPKRARIVFDLKQPVRVGAVTVEPRKQGRFAVAVDLRATAAAIPPAAAAAARTAQPSATPPAAKPVVVIDPGHGGIDPGAVSNKRYLEKVIVLSVGRRLAKALRQTGRFNVVMTRSSDKFISLDGRIDIARKVKANLFLSLHADAVEDSSQALEASGAAVYILSRRASNAAARRLAEKENAADRIAGIIPKVSEDDGGLRNILVDLLKRETNRESTRLRSLLVRGMRKRVPVAKNPMRSAAFHVLKQTETPAALIELGYITNPLDLHRMRKSDWQNRMVAALAGAIDRFFRERQ